MFFADSRLWLGANGKWSAEKGCFGWRQERFSTNENIFSLRKRRLFLFMQGNAKMKAFYKPTAATLFHCAQINGSQQISSAKSYCKLAAQQPIFETSQSCVSTKVTLSHRFKSSPAIPGKVEIPGLAGYLMNASHVSENLESSGDLNRPRESRGSQPSISLKHGRLAHVRSQFSLFRRSPTHKNLPLATFCTSESAFWLLFARRKK